MNGHKHAKKQQDETNDESTGNQADTGRKPSRHSKISNPDAIKHKQKKKNKPTGDQKGKQENRQRTDGRDR